ncbi:MAG TPA: hypothetical protein VEW74_00165 [Candidatus Nitrosotalea sp.]|nr:hypothetical protein [Candidatus Nitrosotalea sp.]
MRTGSELLDLARAAGAHEIFVVGIGRDVGKTTVLRALYSAAHRRGDRIGLASIGREGDPARQGEVWPKPRLWLEPQTLFVSARDSLTRTPAAEIVKPSRLQSPDGMLLYARVVTGAFYELVGAPTASGIREIAGELSALCDLVIVDGAVDRVAALAGSNAAVIVACGAAAAVTVDEAADEVAALVARLAVPQLDSDAAAIEIKGALTTAEAAAFVAAGERRQIVVGDPTQIALSGKAGLRALRRLTIRCRRPLRVVAATVASIGPERSFEPRLFARAVADATALPTFDVYTGERAA